jgi:cytoskeleton protein RodZ
MENMDQEQKVNTQTSLGEFLKSKRVEKNFSLEKLSQKTKISINILKSLELNDFKNLPSPAYIKGFVTSYAKVLSIPQAEVVSRMEQTYQATVGKPFPALNHTKNFLKPRVEISSVEDKVAEQAASPDKIISSSDSILSNTKSIFPIAILATIILLFIGGYKIVSTVIESEVSSTKTKFSGPKIESSSALVNPGESQTKPEAKPAEQAPVELPAETAAETKSEAVSTVAEKTEPKKEAPVKEAKKTELRRNFPTVRFSKIRGRLFTIRTDAPENSNPEIIPPKIKSAFKPELQNVYVKATEGNTWLSYKVDNKPIESVIISKGNDLFLQGSEIRMFLGNVNVTKIFYNNFLIDTPNKSGVKSLVFPETSNEKYILPLFPKANDDIFYTSEEYQKRMKLEEDELGKPE